MTDPILFDRRQLMESTAALLLAGPLTGSRARASESAPAAEPPKWYEFAYRRAVIDMHIPDWDPKFLSEFNPDDYADMLVKSRSQSIVCYCQSHVGLFNYPTKVGQQHQAWNGQNMLQRMIDCCHARGIAVQLYTSLIFDRWAGDQHPEWRMKTWDGKVQGQAGRHAVLCINSPYREYVRRFVTEICQTFEFEGIRFDMTFWPWLCFCEHCQKRFDTEVGGAIPQIVDWLDEKWVAFQRARERWLVEFAAMATGTVRQLKPHASVEHQSSTFPRNWMFGVTGGLASQNDFLQGDFYGDQLQGSFVRKLLDRLSPNRPFGYETSFSRRLQDHTAMKSEALLEAKAASAVADNAAFIFIDAIDPLGTVNPRAHERMGKVFDKLMPYYEHLGGERVCDIAIYYSFESKFDMQGNGSLVRAPNTDDLHTFSCMHAASHLLSRQFPLGVITKESLADLKKIQVLILSNVNMMDGEECSMIREWVRAGGKLLASGGTSLVDKHGKMHSDFMLSDVFGVSLRRADWSARRHYISPTNAGQELFDEFDADYPAFCEGYGFEVRPHADTDVLATTTLPWPATKPTLFSSIHSDPPWRRTPNPEITSHRLGAGQTIYCSSLIENVDALKATYIKLIQKLNQDYHFQAKAPSCIEVTLFRQPELNRYRLSVINFQNELPNLPVHNVEIRLALPERVQRILSLPSGDPMPFRFRAREVVFTVPRIETLAMCAVELR